MTTANEYGDWRPVRRFLMWTGHYYPHISPALYLVLLTSAGVGLWVTPVLPLFWVTAKLVVISVIVGMGLSRDLVHDRNLCLRDLNESPLLDPQAAVDKHLEKLRLHHRHSMPLLLTALMGVIGGGLMLGSTGIAYSWPWSARVAISALIVVGLVAAFRIDRSHVIHDRLRPWCPWCRRRDDGGDEVKLPTPTPGGAITT